MSATNEWEVFDIDRVEDAFVASVREGIIVGVPTAQVTGKFPLPTSQTPCVKITFNTREVQGQRQLLVPNTETRFQPYNVWMFTLAAEVTTQREQNGALHRELVARTRMALQLYKLAVSWNNNLAPYHTVIDIGELAASELVTDDAQTTDSTTLNFSGQIQIDASAWPRMETAPSVNPPVNTVLPTISGDQLSTPSSVTFTGSWTGLPTSFTYQWMLKIGENDPEPIAGETLDTWIISGTEGDVFFCYVTAHNAGGASDPVESNRITIQPAP